MINFQLSIINDQGMINFQRSTRRKYDDGFLNIDN